MASGGPSFFDMLFGGGGGSRAQAAPAPRGFVPSSRAANNNRYYPVR